MLAHGVHLLGPPYTLKSSLTATLPMLSCRKRIQAMFKLKLIDKKYDSIWSNRTFLRTVLCLAFLLCLSVNLFDRIYKKEAPESLVAMINFRDVG